ncbi:DUF1674 domain-containing protein [Plasticicumulans acidivorans]|uniref:DUF1674 domain-containing protein n=1 Tax=Plasticicumulans acidivorans TaxID=886464 RepID=A0A317MWX5_9GAMM|nr:succinate dehydrogenase assembly factor 4 [Plasticicumulans acidivorans]PWV63385.1 hypothetical protein C7443_103310 [Plasticicumulans acidivorans]
MTDSREASQDASEFSVSAELQAQGGSGVAEGAAADATSHNVTATSEVGGRRGPEPTRYGDWEKNGRCIDF